MRGNSGAVMLVNLYVINDLTQNIRQKKKTLKSLFNSGTDVFTHLSNSL